MTQSTNLLICRLGQVARPQEIGGPSRLSQELGGILSYLLLLSGVWVGFEAASEIRPHSLAFPSQIPAEHAAMSTDLDLGFIALEDDRLGLV